MSNKSTLAPGVYLVMEKAGKVLFMKRPDTVYQAGKYMLPGGGVEEDEAPTQATIRETMEELGIKINPTDLQPIYIMTRGAHDDTGSRVDIFFRITSWDGEPKIMEPDKCTELAWFEIDNLPESVPTYVKTALENSQKNMFYSELDY